MTAFLLQCWRVVWAGLRRWQIVVVLAYFTVAALRAGKNMGVLPLAGGLLAGVGFVLNMAVIIANGGFMPVAVRPDEIPESERGRCKPLDGTTRLAFLADRIPVGSLLISPGDVLVVLAVIALVAGAWAS